MKLGVRCKDHNWQAAARIYAKLVAHRGFLCDCKIFNIRKGLLRALLLDNFCLCLVMFSSSLHRDKNPGVRGEGGISSVVICNLY